MKKKIIVTLLVITILISLCGCSVQSLDSDVESFKENWFSNLEDSVVDFKTNWFSNLQTNVESVTSYSFSDLDRETQNLMSFSFDYTYVAYESDLQKALYNFESTDVIVIQRSIELSEDLIIPSGKTVMVQSGVILTVPAEVSVTVKSGSNLIFDGVSYFVLNELGTCFVSDMASLTIGESASLLMVSTDALSQSASAVVTNLGMLQQGSTFYVYSTTAITNAIRSAYDGCTINIPAAEFGNLADYYIYNIDKAISVVGTTATVVDGETMQTVTSTLYGGFVLSADGASVSGMEIYSPIEGGKTTISSTLASGYTAGGAVTIACAQASITNSTLHATDYVVNGIEIFPYYTEEENSQSYTISNNTFVGYGDISKPTTAPIVIREYSTDVTKFGKATASSVLGMTDSGIISLTTSNAFEDCVLRVAVINCTSGEALKTVVAPALDVTEDFIFTCNYYLTGDWNVSGADLIVTGSGAVTVASGVYFNFDENSSLEIMEGGTVTLQSGSVLENYGNVTGEVSGSGNFIDWPNYIQFAMQVETSEDVWEEEMILGEYVGYSVANLRTLYIATKEFSGDNYIIGYEVNFTLSPDGDLLDDSYVFTDNTAVYVDFTGISMPIYYDDNGGSDIGNNRAELTYPRSMYLENATTKKTDIYFAGWTIKDGAFAGDYVSVIDDDFLIELWEAGYTYLNLQANWISKYNLNDLRKIVYLQSSSSTDPYDEHCDVYVYTPAGSDSTTYDIDDYNYVDGTLALVKVANNTGYNDSAYIFFDIEEGYELESVIMVISGSTDEYDLTNQALVAISTNSPLIFPDEKLCTLEVTTKKSTGEIQEIETVGINLNGNFAFITDFTGLSFDCEDEIKFSARTASNEIVSAFYVKAYATDEDGDTTIITYYNPSGIYFGEDYQGGTVYFEIYAIDGVTQISDSFTLNKVFNIV
ncbi:MAG: hypothetical protein R3Y32_09355 [Bacillota bacterium]